MNSKIHICHIVLDYQSGFHQAEDFLQEIFTLTGWCEALVRQGCKVSALLRFHDQDYIEKDGVHYHFFSDPYGPQLKPWQTSSLPIYKYIQKLKPDIVQAHNLNKAWHHRLLFRYFEGPICIMNHAESPSRWIPNFLHRKLLRKTSLVFFTARTQEAPWLIKRILRPRQIRYLPEFSVTPEDLEKGKQGQPLIMQGSPICLWVGNLEKGKDPFTILRAFLQIQRQHPMARLYMVYKKDSLLHSIKQFIRNKNLESAVHMVGPLSRAELFNLYRQSDIFVTGSHREGSGYSANEAVASGCVAVLTDIPAFRVLDSFFSEVHLFIPGNDSACQKAWQKAIEDLDSSARDSLCKRYQAHFGYNVLSQKLLAEYKTIVKT